MGYGLSFIEIKSYLCMILWVLLIWSITSAESSTILWEHDASGGVIRDNSGDWIKGFSKFIGRNLVLFAELWGILEGTKLFNEMNTIDIKLIIQTDSTQASMGILRHIHHQFKKIGVYRCISITKKS